MPPDQEMEQFAFAPENSGECSRDQISEAIESLGTKIAAETRARCNNLSAAERQILLDKGMSIIYGAEHISTSSGVRNGAKAFLDLNGCDFFLGQSDFAGVEITKEQALEGLGNPADWDKEEEELNKDFKKKR